MTSGKMLFQKTIVRCKKRNLKHSQMWFLIFQSKMKLGKMKNAISSIQMMMIQKSFMKNMNSKTKLIKIRLLKMSI